MVRMVHVHIRFLSCMTIIFPACFSLFPAAASSTLALAKKKKNLVKVLTAHRASKRSEHLIRFANFIIKNVQKVFKPLQLYTRNSSVDFI